MTFLERLGQRTDLLDVRKPGFLLRVESPPVGTWTTRFDYRTKREPRAINLSLWLQEEATLRRILIDPSMVRFAHLFTVDRIEANGHLLLLPDPVSASMFGETSHIGFDAHFRIGSALQFQLSFSDRPLRLSVTVRDGAELPEDYREIDPPILRRLHPAHPNTVGEVDLSFDWTLRIPSWASARLSDERDVGEELIEPAVDSVTLETLAFVAYAVFERPIPKDPTRFQGFDPGRLG